MKLKSYSMIFLGILTTSFSYADIPASQNICDATRQRPCIAIDPTAQLWKMRFRYDAWANVYGGPEPRPSDWQGVLAKIPGEKVDLDLREESHLFVDDYPIVRYITNDSLNEGMRVPASLEAEAAWQKSLQKQKTISLLTAEQISRQQFSEKNATVVKVTGNNIQDEKTLATQAGFTYVRLAIQDHHRPRDEDVDTIVNVFKAHPKAVFYVHCREGIGRTSVVMAMFDMLKNAQKNSYQKIIDRQDALSDSNELLKDNKVAYKARNAFLVAFHQYAQTGFTKPWSERCAEYNACSSG